MRKALVIGVNDYPGSPLSGCVNDASRVACLLERHFDGSLNYHVRLVTAPPESLTRSVLRRLIEELFEAPNDSALLYFSGHGAITSSGGYVVTQDAKKYDEGISMDDILKFANNSRARDKIVILDCCYSGSLGSPSITGSNISLIGEGVTVLTACRRTEYAMEAEDGGIFTSLLIDALQGGAADLRGNITPGGLYSYIDEALGAWEQRPLFKTNVSRFTKIRKVNPEISTEIIQKIVEYFPDYTYCFPLDPTFEDTNVDIAIAENVKIFKDLQKFFAVGLVRPVDEEYMYFAAMNSKSCKLTAMGHQYWRLVKENKI